MSPRARKASTVVRDDVLDAATTVLERDGLANLTVRAVATQADVSVVSIYNHYTDKDGLLDAITTLQFEGLRDVLQLLENMAPHMDSRTLLQQAVIEYRTFALRNPEAYKVMFSRDIADLETAHTAFNAFAALIQQGQEAGKFTTSRPAQVIAKVIWSACHGSAILEINDVNLKSIPSTPIDLLDIVVEGILAR